MKQARSPVSRAKPSKPSRSTSSAGGHGLTRLGGSAGPDRTSSIEPFELPIAWEKMAWALAAEVGVDGNSMEDELYMRAVARFYGGEVIDEAAANAYQDMRGVYGAEEAA